MRNSYWWSAALVVALLATPALAQERPVVGADGISFNPAFDYERAVLTVSGAQGVWKESLEGDGPVVFGFAGPDGEALTDGGYTWELRLVPVGGPIGDVTERGNAPRLQGLVHSGHFRILDGLVVGALREDVPGRGPGTGGGTQTRDQVFLDDLIVEGSACIGLDCVNGESFGFDTLRLKENNLRLHFQDTSTSASFPSNDWRLTANDSSNGGRNIFLIDDVDAGRSPFAIEAGAPANSLYVEDGGRIGIGTSTPVVEVHVVDGDTPTVRLEQDGSSGFTPQTWDLAGNETNFFVRDVTNGSRLPFRVRPSAPTNSIYVDTDGKVGMGTENPSAELSVVRTSASDKDMLLLSNAGRSDIIFQNTTTAQDTWTMSHANTGVFAIDTGGGATEFRIQASGNVLLEGSLTANATTTMDMFPDYVFEPDYELMPLSEVQAFIEREKHLPGVMSSADVDGGRKVNMTKLQLQILEKVEELTLYTLDQQEIIDSQQAVIEALEARLAELEELQ